MNWTTEFPTKHGYYWIRNYIRRWTNAKPHSGPYLVEIKADISQDDEPLDLMAFPGHEALWHISDVISAEWYGPLEPPA